MKLTIEVNFSDCVNKNPDVELPIILDSAIKRLIEGNTYGMIYDTDKVRVGTFQLTNQ